MVINTLASDRKALVQALAEHLDLEARYNGPPGFSYSVGDITIDRDGQVILPEGMDAEGIKAFLITKQWLAPEVDFLNIKVPIQNMKPDAMKNLVYTLYCKQYLLNKATGSENFSVHDSLIAQLKENLPPTLLDFVALMNDFRTRGELDGITFTDENVTFHFPLTHETAAIEAYIHLGVRLVETAKQATRVFPERQQPQNEKYDMYTWLMRIGLGGGAFKKTRQALLHRLKGNSAFKNDEEAQKHRDKYAQIRRVKREGSERKEGMDE